MTSAGDGPFDRLRPVDADGFLNVIIETAAGSRNKYRWDPELELFALRKTLPVGATFPFDFGFIPNTLGGDGDPLDVLVLMDDAAFPGCHVRARLLGVLEVKQTEPDGTAERNDRLIAVAAQTRDHEGITRLEDVGDSLLDQIEHFFNAYNEYDGKTFDVVRRAGPELARRLVDRATDGRVRSTPAGIESKTSTKSKPKGAAGSKPKGKSKPRAGESKSKAAAGPGPGTAAGSIPAKKPKPLKRPKPPRKSKSDRQRKRAARHSRP